MTLRSPIPFKPFDPEAAYSVYHTRLPHWRQRGCTYFVTFRLKDSLPAACIQKLQRYHDHWSRQNGLGEIDPSNDSFRQHYQRIDAKQRAAFEREYALQLNRYLDAGHGACVLRSATTAELLEECLKKFDGQRLRLGDRVIMPNHVHLLITPKDGYELSELLSKIKGASARRINQSLGTNGTLWMKHSFDHIVRSWGSLEKFQRYIADNPFKAGLKLPAVCYHRATYTPV